MGQRSNLAPRSPVNQAPQFQIQRPRTSRTLLIVGLGAGLIALMVGIVSVQLARRSVAQAEAERWSVVAAALASEAGESLAVDRPRARARLSALLERIAVDAGPGVRLTVATIPTDGMGQALTVEAGSDPAATLPWRPELDGLWTGERRRHWVETGGAEGTWTFAAVPLRVGDGDRLGLLLVEAPASAAIERAARVLVPFATMLWLALVATGLFGWFAWARSRETLFGLASLVARSSASEIGEQAGRAGFGVSALLRSVHLRLQRAELRERMLSGHREALVDTVERTRDLLATRRPALDGASQTALRMSLVIHQQAVLAEAGPGEATATRHHVQSAAAVAVASSSLLAARLRDTLPPKGVIAVDIPRRLESAFAALVAAQPVRQRKASLEISWTGPQGLLADGWRLGDLLVTVTDDAVQRGARLYATERGKGLFEIECDQEDASPRTEADRWRLGRVEELVSQLGGHMWREGDERWGCTLRLPTARMGPRAPRDGALDGVEVLWAGGDESSFRDLRRALAGSGAELLALRDADAVTEAVQRGAARRMLVLETEAPFFLVAARLVAGLPGLQVAWASFDGRRLAEFGREQVEPDDVVRRPYGRWETRETLDALARRTTVQLLPQASDNRSAGRAATEATVRLLIVDADGARGPRLRVGFRHLGWQADRVESPVDALEALERVPYDVVMVHAEAGANAAGAVCALVRELPPPQSRTPVVVRRMDETETPGDADGEVDGDATLHDMISEILGVLRWRRGEQDRS